MPQIARQNLLRASPLAVAVVLMAALPIWMTNSFWVDLVSLGLVFGLLAISVDMLWGYSGILNLGPVVSFGLGAYAWAIVTERMEGEAAVYVAVVVAVVLPAALAGAVAYIAFRGGAKEIYFALITLALVLIFDQVARGWLSLTGGSSGLVGIPWPRIGGMDLDTSTSFYYLVFVWVCIILLASVRLLRSRIGLALQATKQNEVRAETLGYSTLRLRVLASVIAGAIAGMAGALYAPLTGIVDPTVFAVGLTIQIYVWVAIGGQGTLLWPLVAAVLITIGQSEFTGGSAVIYNLAIGAIFVFVVIVMPGGVASVVLSLARRMRAWITARRVAGETRANG